MPDHDYTEDKLRKQLEIQGWECTYPCDPAARWGGKIEPGDSLALAHDGRSIVHLRCAEIGRAPA